MEPTMDESELKKKPSASRFVQQQLPSYAPVPTAKSGIIMFSILGLIFLIFGIVLLSFAGQIQEYSERYDDASTCERTTWEDTTSKPCTIEIEVDDDMTGPVYLYYELIGFFQNHRRYVKSRSYDQNQGEDLSEDDVKEYCAPIVTYDDLERAPAQLPTELKAEDSDPANPCGLIAKTLFNDTYVVKAPGGKAVEIDEEGIALDSDIDRAFSRLDDDWEKEQWTDVEDEHYIVWMRTSAFPRVRKLWGIIDEDLDKGTYTVEIINNYDAEEWDGEKWIVLSTVNSFGGNNLFLGVMLCLFAGLSLLMVVLLLLKLLLGKKREPPNPADESSLVASE